jgi:hypothetical protein
MLPLFLLFQVHDQLMTEISLMQISLASQVWQLSKKVVVPEGWLQFLNYKFRPIKSNYKLL